MQASGCDQRNDLMMHTVAVDLKWVNLVRDSNFGRISSTWTCSCLTPVPAASSSTAAPAAKAVQVMSVGCGLCGCRSGVRWCSTVAVFLLVAEVVSFKVWLPLVLLVLFEIAEEWVEERGGPTNILLLFLMGPDCPVSLSLPLSPLWPSFWNLSFYLSATRWAGRTP